jgi:superoxide reductase
MEIKASARARPEWERKLITVKKSLLRRGLIWGKFKVAKLEFREVAMKAVMEMKRTNRRKFIKSALLGLVGLTIGSKSAVAKALLEGAPIFGAETQTLRGKQHTPVVKAPEVVKAGEPFEVEVEIGHYEGHESTQEHHIDNICLWVNNREVGSVEVKAGEKPKAKFTVVLDRPGTVTLRGFGNCTEHGLWVSEPVKVKVV